VTTQPSIGYPLSLDEPLTPRPICEDISVVIPTLGRPILETCLRHLADGTHWPQRLIVVDQGRVPAVRGMLARLARAGLPATYLPSEQRGKSAGLNLGLDRVTSRFVALTDDDCLVRADWLECLVTRLRREPDVIWTGRVEAAGDQRAFSTVLSRTPRRYCRPQVGVHPFSGGNVGMAMDVTRRIGPFDEHPSLMASSEDADYGYRALRLGIPIAYDPDIVLHHYHWRDENQRTSRYADYARSQGAFYGKHLRNGGGALMALQAARAILRGPWRWLRGVALRDPELERNGRESTRNLLPGLLEGLRRNDRRPH
jgi:GT2 family glycosyltransferase